MDKVPLRNKVSSSQQIKRTSVLNPNEYLMPQKRAKYSKAPDIPLAKITNLSLIEHRNKKRDSCKTFNSQNESLTSQFHILPLRTQTPSSEIRRNSFSLTQIYKDLLIHRRGSSYDTPTYDDKSKFILLKLIFDYSTAAKDQFCVVNTNKRARNMPEPLIRRQLLVSLELLREMYNNRNRSRTCEKTFRTLLDKIEFSKWVRLKKRAPLSKVVCVKCFNVASMLESIDANFDTFNDFLADNMKLDVEETFDLANIECRNNIARLRNFEQSVGLFLSKFLLNNNKSLIRFQSIEWDHSTARDTLKTIKISTSEFLRLFFIEMLWI